MEITALSQTKQEIRSTCFMTAKESVFAIGSRRRIVTRVFVNGKEVKKSDLGKIEIKCEALNQIISDKQSEKS